MARPTINEDRKTFLSQLRRLKTSVGNLALRTQLGWNEARYWKAHSSLVEDGRIVKGRGRGGSVQVA
jgi:type I restriction enzyme M protein